MRLRCFVVMPFGEGFEPVYDAIATAANALSPAVDIEFMRADRDRIDWDIATNVRKHIEMCDFAIADITGNNPNVTYEVGYLQALKKPVILLTRQAPPSPSWRLPYAIYTEDRLNDLPAALRPFLSVVSDELAEHSSTEQAQPVAYSSTPGEEIVSSLRTASREVDILATNLAGTFSVGIFDEIIRLLKTTLVRIRILALNPESFLASARASQLGLGDAQYRKSLVQSLAQSAELTARFPDRCEIRLYDELPYQGIYRIDNVVFIALLTSHRTSRDSVVIRFSLMGGDVAREMIRLFDLVWARAMPLNQAVNRE